VLLLIVPTAQQTPLHIAQLPTALRVYCALSSRQKPNYGFKRSLHHWKQLPNLFITSLPTAASSKKRLRAILQIAFLIRNICMESLKSSHSLENGWSLQLISKLYPLRKTNQSITLSAQSNSLATIPLMTLL
jgi:hypothetical protein